VKRIHKISRLGACSFKHAPYLIIALFKFVAYAPWKVHIYAQYAPSKVHIYVFFFQSFKLFAKSVLVPLFLFYQYVAFIV
jgi:hypothetical protein